MRSDRECDGSTERKFDNGTNFKLVPKFFVRTCGRYVLLA